MILIKEKILESTPRMASWLCSTPLPKIEPLTRPTNSQMMTLAQMDPYLKCFIVLRQRAALQADIPKFKNQLCCVILDTLLNLSESQFSHL